MRTLSITEMAQECFDSIAPTSEKLRQWLDIAGRLSPDQRLSEAKALLPDVSTLLYLVIVRCAWRTLLNQPIEISPLSELFNDLCELSQFLQTNDSHQAIGQYFHTVRHYLTHPTPENSAELSERLCAQIANTLKGKPSPVELPESVSLKELPLGQQAMYFYVSTSSLHFYEDVVTPVNAVGSMLLQASCRRDESETLCFTECLLVGGLTALYLRWADQRPLQSPGIQEQFLLFNFAKRSAAYSCPHLKLIERIMSPHSSLALTLMSDHYRAYTVFQDSQYYNTERFGLNDPAYPSRSNPDKHIGDFENLVLNEEKLQDPQFSERYLTHAICVINYLLLTLNSQVAFEALNRFLSHLNSFFHLLTITGEPDNQFYQFVAKELVLNIGYYRERLDKIALMGLTQFRNCSKIAYSLIRVQLNSFLEKVEMNQLARSHPVIQAMKALQPNFNQLKDKARTLITSLFEFQFTEVSQVVQLVPDYSNQLNNIDQTLQSLVIPIKISQQPYDKSTLEMWLEWTEAAWFRRLTVKTIHEYPVAIAYYQKGRVIARLGTTVCVLLLKLAETNNDDSNKRYQDLIQYYIRLYPSLITLIPPGLYPTEPPNAVNDFLLRRDLTMTKQQKSPPSFNRNDFNLADTESITTESDKLLLSLFNYAAVIFSERGQMIHEQPVEAFNQIKKMLFIILNINKTTRTAPFRSCVPRLSEHAIARQCFLLCLYCYFHLGQIKQNSTSTHTQVLLSSFIFVWHTVAHSLTEHPVCDFSSVEQFISGLFLNALTAMKLEDIYYHWNNTPYESKRKQLLSTLSQTKRHRQEQRFHPDYLPLMKTNHTITCLYQLSQGLTEQVFEDMLPLISEAITYTLVALETNASPEPIWVAATAKMHAACEHFAESLPQLSRQLLVKIKSFATTDLLKSMINHLTALRKILQSFYSKPCAKNHEFSTMIDKLTKSIEHASCLPALKNYYHQCELKSEKLTNQLLISKEKRKNKAKATPLVSIAKANVTAPEPTRSTTPTMSVASADDENDSDSITDTSSEDHESTTPPSSSGDDIQVAPVSPPSETQDPVSAAELSQSEQFFREHQLFYKSKAVKKLHSVIKDRVFYVINQHCYVFPFGGLVRDLIHHKTPNDYDFKVTETVDGITALLQKAVDDGTFSKDQIHWRIQGSRIQTVFITFNHRHYDVVPITHHRIARPEQADIVFTALCQSLSSADLTVNCVALDVNDYQGKNYLLSPARHAFSHIAHHIIYPMAAIDSDNIKQSLIFAWTNDPAKLFRLLTLFLSSEKWQLSEQLAQHQECALLSLSQMPRSNRLLFAMAKFFDKLSNNFNLPLLSQFFYKSFCLDENNANPYVIFNEAARQVTTPVMLNEITSPKHANSINDEIERLRTLMGEQLARQQKPLADGCYLLDIAVAANNVAATVLLLFCNARSARLSTPTAPLSLFALREALHSNQAAEDEDCQEQLMRVKLLPAIAETSAKRL